MDEGRVIAEVAKRNGVLLAPNDPIMQISTMLDLHAEDHHERLAAMEERDLELLTGLSRVLERAEKHTGGALATKAAADLPKAVQALTIQMLRRTSLVAGAAGLGLLLVGLGAGYWWGSSAGAAARGQQSMPTSKRSMSTFLASSTSH
jgi:hypothetical protein